VNELLTYGITLDSLIVV